MAAELKIDKISLEEETFSDDALFNISSYGVDLSFREIISMYEEGDLEKPEMQRKYVWSRNEASRFIDSILLGLPVPSIYSTYKGCYFNDKRSTFISSNEWRNTYESISYRKIYSIKDKTEKSNTGTISIEAWRIQ